MDVLNDIQRQSDNHQIKVQPEIISPSFSNNGYITGGWLVVISPVPKWSLLNHGTF